MRSFLNEKRYFNVSHDSCFHSRLYNLPGNRFGKPKDSVHPGGGVGGGEGLPYRSDGCHRFKLKRTSNRDQNSVLWA